MPEFLPESWYQGLLNSFSLFSPASTASDLIGTNIAVKAWAQLLALSTPMPSHLMLIHSMHSELTESERRFIYGFFSRLWSGKSNVLEIGPFLGSSSRAICLGMLMNEKRAAGVKLYTYDKFEGYYETEGHFKILQDQLPEALVNIVRETGSFKECFDYCHAEKEYSHLLESGYGVLPGKPEDVATLKNCFTLKEGIEFDTVFVDGAKSWYGTKFFFQKIAQHVKPGAYIIFQDFGHYTCFWLSAFVALLKNNFRLVMNIDNTYTFELVNPLDADEIEKNFPDHPAGLSAEQFDQLYFQEMRGANLRSDTYALLSLSLHHAAALAYIGKFDDAKIRILRLAAQPYFVDYMNVITTALKSPTYTPEGPIQLPE
jgi:hypothetical protein